MIIQFLYELPSLSVSQALEEALEHEVLILQALKNTPGSQKVLEGFVCDELKGEKFPKEMKSSEDLDLQDFSESCPCLTWFRVWVQWKTWIGKISFQRI